MKSVVFPVLTALVVVTSTPAPARADDMFAAFVVSSNEARPTRSIASQRLRYNVNNVNVGQLPLP